MPFWYSVTLRSCIGRRLPDDAPQPNDVSARPSEIERSLRCMLTTVSPSAVLVTAAIAIGGCANSYQSARTLEPGRTQVALAVSRGQLYFEDGGDDGSWMADLQVRHG